MRFELFKGGFFRKRWYWRLVAGNNEIVAQSQGYQQRSSAIETCWSIRSRMKSDTPILGDDRNPILDPATPSDNDDWFQPES